MPSTRRAPSAIATRRRLADDGALGHAEQVELHPAGVRDDRADEAVARAGYTGEPGADQPAGHRFGEPDREPSVPQQLEHDRLHRVVVDAEHDRPEDSSRSRRSTGRATAVAASDDGALAVRRTLIPSHPLARKARVGVPSASSRSMSGIEPLVEPALALAPHPQHPAGDHRRLAGPPAQVGQHGALEHLLHLVGHAGHGVDDPIAHRADQPGRGAARLGDHRRPVGHHRLAKVAFGHRSAPGCEHVSDRLGHRLVGAKLDPHHLGDRLTGDVVVGGAEPAAHDHRVGLFEGPPQRSHDAVEVVTDLPLGQRVDAVGGELLPDPRRVGVDDLAEQQLGADGDDVTSHGRSPRLWAFHR